MKTIATLCFSMLVLGITSCKKDKNDPDPVAEPKLIFVFDFDSTQVRLNNFG